MDNQTLGAAIALMKKILPATADGDEGKVLVVGADGHWVAGESTTAVLSVDNHILTVQGGQAE